MFWLTKFFTKGKSVKDAIAYFFKLNNRMPDNIEIIKIKNAFMDQTRKSNVIDITSRIKDDWWKQRSGFKRQHPEVTKKIDADPHSALLDRQSKELEGIDTKQGMGFYRELGDTMKKHSREELEFKYDEMFNKILEKAKRIEADPKVLLEAELGKKLTGKETTTQLLDLFKNRPKKASGGIAGQLHLNRPGYAGGKIVKGASWVIKNLRKSRQEVIEGTGQFSKLNPMEQESLKWELSALIKQLERGGKIPDDMLQTMRQDKRFKDIVKTPSTDPELRELEEVLLGSPDPNFPKGYWHTKKDGTKVKMTGDKNLDYDYIDTPKGHEVVPGSEGAFYRFGKEHKKFIEDSVQKRKLEQFDVTGKTKHAYGGIAGELHLNDGGRVSFTKGGKVSSGLAHVLGV